MSESKEFKKLYEEHLVLLHAMQSGVMSKMVENDKRQDPDKYINDLKHLRVGINSNACQISGLTELLVDKGVITFEEAMEYNNKFLKKEVKMYEDELSKIYGTKVTLG